MKKVLFLLVFILLFAAENKGLSQPICPPQDGVNCTPWELGILVTSTESPECQLTVYYRYRLCDWVYQFYIDSLFKSGNCEYLVNGSDNKSFFDWVNILLIQNISDMRSLPSVRLCPDSSIKVTFYTATCGLWVKCRYVVDPRKRVCDPDWRGAYPDQGNSEVSYLDYWKWQNCGQTCCKKTYAICKENDAVGNGFTVHIKSMTKERVGQCSNPDNFVKPCEDGC